MSAINRRGLAGLLCLGMLGASCALAAPCYVNVKVSDKATVYVQFDGAAMRMADSQEGLAKAQAVKATRSVNTTTQFPETPLPVPADKLPAGVNAVRAAFSVYAANNRPAPYVYGELTQERPDDQKVSWSYATPAGVEGATSAAKATVIALPALDKASLQLQTTAKSKTLGVAVTVKSGAQAISNVRKEGKPVPATLIVTNAAGNEVARESRPLDNFGMS